MYRFVALILLVSNVAIHAEDSPQYKKIRGSLEHIDPVILTPKFDEFESAKSMLYTDMKARRREANLRETKAWRDIDTRDKWETYRDKRLLALLDSLGEFPDPPKKIRSEVTNRFRGQGYVIENVVFESRPGLVVTANLYRPAKSPESMPGILICHSHHAPKTQGELQDMGITWAKQGCLVLVMDQLGHGERRQHPFPKSSSYPKSFRVSRQDYYFRYNTGIQLHLVGESLLGWMAWDLLRGVDLLLQQPGIDPKRIILLGAVAGGGDPATVTAAIDRRITAVVPFNFGGPQPETVFPLPKDAENRFNYAGGGSWESTRNLRLSIRDGFFPWMLAGSIVPHGLIYAHEFSWDEEHDPVWRRLQKLQRLYDVDRLASVKGKGSVRLRPPEATHCTNIGPVHRAQIYPTLKKWFDMPIPEKDRHERRTSSQLACLTPEVERKFGAKKLHVLLDELAKARLDKARAIREKLPEAQRKKDLRDAWKRVLGPIIPKAQRKILSHRDLTYSGIYSEERILLEVERGIYVPLLLIRPPKTKRPRVVVIVAQKGKASILKTHREAIARCLSEGLAVCLPDLRGTGETRLGSARGRRSSSTGLSSSELMLGRTLVGLRLRDLLAVLEYLRRPDLAGEFLLWGTSSAPVNDPKSNLAVPLGIEMPKGSEPLGGLLVLLGALFDDQVRGVCVQGGLVSLRDVLSSQFLYLPHDVVLPGVLETGDLDDLAAGVGSIAIRLEGLVDGRNRRGSAEDLAKAYPRTKNRLGKSLTLVAEPSSDAELSKWLSRVGAK